MDECNHRVKCGMIELWDLVIFHFLFLYHILLSTTFRLGNKKRIDHIDRPIFILFLCADSKTNISLRIWGTKAKWGHVTKRKNFFFFYSLGKRPWDSDHFCNGIKMISTGCLWSGLQTGWCSLVVPISGSIWIGILLSRRNEWDPRAVSKFCPGLLNGTSGKGPLMFAVPLKSGLHLTGSFKN